jgi:hypothetical protein
MFLYLFNTLLDDDTTFYIGFCSVYKSNCITINLNKHYQWVRFIVISNVISAFLQDPRGNHNENRNKYRCPHNFAFLLNYND